MSGAYRLLSRPGCHLCEEMRARVEPLFRARGERLVETDVDSEEALAARFGDEIPVILDPDGRVVAKLRDGTDAVARRLARRA